MANKFEKIRVIGSGSFGQAWLVCSKQSKRKYVVKEMQVSNMTEKERNQALNEVSILARLKHKHVIRYRQAFVNNGMLCIAMEYADGGDMGVIIKRKIETKTLILEHRITDWFVQICLALEYIHALNILHRDLKPQNIFVTSDDLVKVGDFGIARILRNADEHAYTAIGTPYYLSPEICCRKSYNQKSDMWAAGCILYELSTLRHPFDATDFSSLVVKILSAKFKPLSRVYGPFLNDLISVLLSVNPNDRPSAEQILRTPAIQRYLAKKSDGSMTSARNNASEVGVVVDALQQRGQQHFVSKESPENQKEVAKTLSTSQKRKSSGHSKLKSSRDNAPPQVDVYNNNHEVNLPSVVYKEVVGRNASCGNTTNKPSRTLENMNSSSDHEIKTPKMRKYSVNRTGIHLGVSRGTRCDDRRMLTPTIYLNKDDVVHQESPSIVVVNRFISSEASKCSSCSKTSPKNCKRRIERQTKSSISDQYSTPTRELNATNRKSASLQKSLIAANSRSRSSSGSNVRRATTRKSDIKHTSETSEQNCYSTSSLRCTGEAEECIDHNSDLTLSDLMSDEDVKFVEVESEGDVYSLDFVPSGSKMRAAGRHMHYERQNDNDKENIENTMIHDGNDRITDINVNNTKGYTVEQMYFWARKLTHCERVDASKLEMLRRFLENRVPLIKLKAIRCILKQGDLQDDDSLMLVIKEVLGNHINVLPLVLELHFMESTLG
ncbi:uncharacterized protein [Antedon mediterranea]|uniref:uncharacterized protein n=1 Tax=Antedon mediterranea TaxID=105859 RepID=UPI003AF857AB